LIYKQFIVNALEYGSKDFSPVSDGNMRNLNAMVDKHKLINLSCRGITLINRLSAVIITYKGNLILLKFDLSRRFWQEASSTALGLTTEKA